MKRYLVFPITPRISGHAIIKRTRAEAVKEAQRYTALGLDMLAVPATIDLSRAREFYVPRRKRGKKTKK